MARFVFLLLDGVLAPLAVYLERALDDWSGAEVEET